MKIGLSFDQGTPKYRLYLGAVLAAAESLGWQDDTNVVWLAGASHAADPAMLDTLDGLLLTGGADVEPERYGAPGARDLCETFPGRDDAELAMIRTAFQRRLPILAICRGMQLLNVFQGGTLISDPGRPGHQLTDDERHPVDLEQGSALHRLLGSDRSTVTSSHHQAIDVLGEDLTAVAHHADGTIEAIEWTAPLRKPWLVAVQWHPERMGLDEPFGASVLRGFLDAVRTRG